MFRYVEAFEIGKTIQRAAHIFGSKFFSFGQTEKENSSIVFMAEYNSV